MALDYSRELDASVLVRDTRPAWDKFIDSLSVPPVAFAAACCAASIGFIYTPLAEVSAVIAVGLTIAHRRIRNSREEMPLRAPKSSGMIDKNELDPKTEQPKKAEGIIYLGNDRESGEQIWLTDDMARTHMLFMGTTGSGKTEMLISMVSNALIHASGLIYVDGKADSSLYGKLYSMARLFGREQDVLVINFQTGARDIFGPQSIRMSNTMNPFAVGSSGMLSQLSVSLMSTGKADIWEGRAISFVEALMKPLVFLRDNYGLYLDVNVIRSFFELPMVEELVYEWVDKYPGLDEALDGLKSYLINLPAYDRALHKKQGNDTNVQHGYVTMQLIRSFNSLADTYGYIMRTPLAEIDFLDVFLNRRILIVLLPALEKAPAELTNLGRIIVASIKATMAVGLGSVIEGDWDETIESKATSSTSPFMCVLDEYGYYAVEGFAVVPAQARSLGFSAIFAGQDLPAFQKASEKEAESTLANTNTKLCGKMTCVKTYKYFSDIAGHGFFTRTSGYVSSIGSMVGGRNYRDGDNASVDKMERVTMDVLTKQPSGRWHLFFGGKIIRINGFFADFSKRGKRNVNVLRVNRFLKVRRPEYAKAKAYKGSYELADSLMSAAGGLGASIEAIPNRDLSMLSDALEWASKEAFVGQPQLLQVLGSLAQVQENDGISDASYVDIMGYYGGDSTEGAQEFDFEPGVKARSPGQPSDAHDFVGGMQSLGGRGEPRRTNLLGPEADEWNVQRDDAAMYGVDLDDPATAHAHFSGGSEPEPKRSRAHEVADFDREWYGDDDDMASVRSVFAGSSQGFDVQRFDSGEIHGFAPKFETSNEEGALNREQTAAGIYAIQKRLGNTRDEASVAASQLTQAMSASTYYVSSKPLVPTTPESFLRIAQRVSDAFAQLDKDIHGQAEV